MRTMIVDLERLRTILQDPSTLIQLLNNLVELDKRGILVEEARARYRAEEGPARKAMIETITPIKPSAATLCAACNRWKATSFYLHPTKGLVYLCTRHQSEVRYVKLALPSEKEINRASDRFMEMENLVRKELR